ncbi:MAG TPA: nitroreductase/quinone reductase family protein [Acidimicrobiales bacterium]|nr:nitroreductase/quinone reductase family protein [Acidimicrobiales bacterium]
MPSDLAFRALNRFHRTVQTLSGGRLGWSAWDMPVLKLTTTGRRSGERRTVLLTSPLQEGDTLVLVASRGGDDTMPAWFLNLSADPEVEVSVGGAAPRPMRAEVAGPEERARLWPLITSAHPNYADYQKRTARQIPVVVLRPAPE